MGNWVQYKPKFKKECLLITASKYSNTWHYNSWWIKQIEDYDGKWYWGWLTIDGDEYGDITDLSADWYKTVNLPETQSHTTP